MVLPSIQPSLKEAFILVAGSASRSAAPDLLDRAHAYVCLLVREVLNAGGGLIVFASTEPKDESGRALVFDWDVIRAVDAAVTEEATSPRLIIVTSERARTEKMNADQRQLIGRLALRNVAEIVNLPSDLVTGGNIGDEQIERASAMIAIGGGKGVADRARKLMKRRIPILPLDIGIGASSEDGEGAVGLHRNFMTEPSRFMPRTGAIAQTRCLALSLHEPVQCLEDVANGSVAIISAELYAERCAAPMDVLVLTALPVELQAAQMALGVMEGTEPQRASIGANYWRSQLQRRDGSIVTCGVACFGTAGNVDAAAFTATLLTEFRPKHVVMIGIAAGMRGKCNLGQVVISDRMVAYEGAAVTEGGKEEARPEIYRPTFDAVQDVAAYLAAPAEVQKRLSEARSRHGIELPQDVQIGPVADNLMPVLATIASGEQLLRDPTKFRQLRELHGKVEVVEMEGVGIFAACAQHKVTSLVVRGISDFGDSTKDNRLHEPAAKAAAVVAVDLLTFGLRKPA